MAVATVSTARMNPERSVTIHSEFTQLNAGKILLSGKNPIHG